MKHCLLLCIFSRKLMPSMSQVAVVITHKPELVSHVLALPVAQGFDVEHGGPGSYTGAPS